MFYDRLYTIINNNNITTIIINKEHNLKSCEMLYGHIVFQSIFVPPDKVNALQVIQSSTISQYKITIKEMQTLDWSLAFISKTIPAGRAFAGECTIVVDLSLNHIIMD